MYYIYIYIKITNPTIHYCYYFTVCSHVLSPLQLCFHPPPLCYYWQVTTHILRLYVIGPIVHYIRYFIQLLFKSVIRREKYSFLLSFIITLITFPRAFFFFLMQIQLLSEAICSQPEEPPLVFLVREVFEQHLQFAFTWESLYFTFIFETAILKYPAGLDIGFLADKFFL